VDRRRFLLTSLAGALAAPLGAGAQQAGKVYRIGILAEEPTDTAYRRPEVRVAIDAFNAALRDHGWIENQNFVFVRRITEGRRERYAQAAAELVALQPDVIVTPLGDAAVLALKNATTTTPVVMLVAADPVGTGLVTSLARPGGNITGMSILAPDVSGKRLALLKEAIPRVTRVALLWNSADPGKVSELRYTEAAATALRLTVHPVEVRAGGDFPRAFSIITGLRPEAIVVFSDPLTVVNARQIVAYATQQRLPLIAELRHFAETGALMSYGASLAEMFRRSAAYVDKILRGSKPADLPVEQPTKFEFVINLKTAKALGLTIPPSLLVRADQVIE
jgi:putative tryptophan/tyrosine transport system substrate-binding protein